jgi:hypothetical protein
VPFAFISHPNPNSKAFNAADTNPNLATNAWHSKASINLRMHIHEAIACRYAANISKGRKVFLQGAIRSGVGVGHEMAQLPF